MLDIPYHRIDQFQKGTNEFAVVNIWAFIPSPVIIVDHYTSPAFPFLAEEPGKQGNQSDTDEGHTATGHQLFHPQLGVKTLLDGGRRRTKNLYGVVKRTVPAGQVRQ